MLQNSRCRNKRLNQWILKHEIKPPFRRDRQLSNGKQCAHLKMDSTQLYQCHLWFLTIITYVNWRNCKCQYTFIHMHSMKFTLHEDTKRDPAFDQKHHCVQVNIYCCSQYRYPQRWGSIKLRNPGGPLSL